MITNAYLLKQVQEVANATKEKTQKKYSSVELRYNSAEALKISMKFAEEAKKNWL